MKKAVEKERIKPMKLIQGIVSDWLIKKGYMK